MYGAAAVTLPSLDKLKLLANIPAVLAEEELRNNPLGRGKSHDEYYDLLLAATGDEEQARKRTKARRAAMLREGIESL